MSSEFLSSVSRHRTQQAHAMRAADMLFSALHQETTFWYPFSVKTEQFQTEVEVSKKQIQETEAKGDEGSNIR